MSRTNWWRHGVWGLSLVLALAGMTRADVRLPRIFGDHMVLQCDKPIVFWGWADAGEKITVKVGSETAQVQAGQQIADEPVVRWMVKLPAQKAGGPVNVEVTGKNKIVLEDVLIGEVWIGSGQSNMEWGLKLADNAEKEIAEADYPQIRLFHVPKDPAGEPQDDVDAAWKVCSPKTIEYQGGGSFSAVAYFFGRELHKKLNIPVGLIESAWGGTRIEPWTTPEGFASVDSLKDLAKQVEDANQSWKETLKTSLAEYDGWLAACRKALAAGKRVPLPPAFPKHPLDSNGQPTGLYNGMIHPLCPFAMRGAIWYQGESNNPDGAIYCDKMKALIGSWRQRWGQGDFPFYYVQIAPLDAAYEGDRLPRLWEAQSAALSIPNTGMVVTTDIADLKDIHPKNKQEVGRRLALWALAKDYNHKDLVYSGPLYRDSKVEGDSMRISFEHTGGGLAARDNQPLNWFQIAGADRNFVDAKAVIDGHTLVVSSPEVKQPVAVRFAWHRTAVPNLVNKEGLPASPFRTDRW